MCSSDHWRDFLSSFSLEDLVSDIQQVKVQRQSRGNLLVQQFIVELAKYSLLFLTGTAFFFFMEPKRRVLKKHSSITLNNKPNIQKHTITP